MKPIKHEPDAEEMGQVNAIRIFRDETTGFRKPGRRDLREKRRGGAKHQACNPAFSPRVGSQVLFPKVQHYYPDDHSGPDNSRKLPPRCSLQLVCNYTRQKAGNIQQEIVAVSPPMYARKARPARTENNQPAATLQHDLFG